MKGDFNLQARFLVEYKLSMLSARLEQTAKKNPQGLSFDAFPD